MSKEIEKTNKSEANYLIGTYTMIANKLKCSRKYVSMVLNNKLGKYQERETSLVKKIREMAEKLEAL